MSLESKQSKNYFLLLLCVFITQLDAGIIGTALSSIQQTFQVNEINLSWTISIYTLSLVFSTAFMGSVIDLFGYKKTLLIEMICYFIGLIGIYFSPYYWLFLIFRAIQALGSSSVLIIAISYILEIEKKHKGKKVGSIGMIAALSAIIAPLISVLILKIFSQWKSIFLILGIAVFCLIIVIFKRMSDMETLDSFVFDRYGNLLFTFSILLLMLALSAKSDQLISWTSFLILLLASGLMFWAFGVVERKNSQPLFSEKLLAFRNYRLSLISGFFCGLFMATFIYMVSLLEEQFKLPNYKAGLFLILLGIGSLIGAKLSGDWVDKFGSTAVIRISSIAIPLTFCFFLVSYFSLWLFGFSLLAFGFSMSMLMTSPLQIMIAEVSKKDKNRSLSFLSITKKFGLGLGTLLSGIIFTLTERYFFITHHFFVFFTFELLLSILFMYIAYSLTSKPEIISDEKNSALEDLEEREDQEYF